MHKNACTYKKHLKLICKNVNSYVRVESEQVPDTG